MPAPIPALIAAAMARRTKIVVHFPDGPFDCYPRDDAQRDRWVAKYRAEGHRVDVEAR